MNLTSHFSLEEMTASDYGTRNSLVNIPSEEAIENLRALCTQVLEPLRRILQERPIRVTSGYRSPQINAGIGGSKSSQHMKGMAADIKVPGLLPQDVFVKLITSNLIYDQVILEFDTWVHVSYNRFGGNRMERLIAHKVDGETIYEGIWNPENLTEKLPPATST